MSAQSSLHQSKSWIERYALICYFALTFLIGWIPMIPRVLASRGLLPASLSISLFDLILVLSPAISALIITGITQGRAGVRALLLRYGIWRVGLGWYAAALFLPGLIYLGIIIFSTLLGKTSQASPPLPTVVGTFVVSLVFQCIFNQEEIGWRGFALPRMQAHWSALQSSVVLAVIWGLWHIPLFLTRGTPNANIPYLGFMIGIVAQSIMQTWMFNSTRGSLLLSQLFHQSFNAWAAALIIVPSVAGGDATAYWISVVLFWFVAIGLTVIYGAMRLSRQPVQQADLPATAP
ncbi:MAG: CPBP family glutamic-type intramembrane protease [Aggregatilineales bacterium]